MNKNTEQISAALLERLKLFFTKNWGLKVISLLFAILLWGYVMMETNPSRTKTVTEIPVSFSGESELLDKGLVVRGDHEDILKSVTARVSVELTKYTGLDASDINATVSLRSVSKADTYKLKVNATTSQGTVLSVSPSEIVIEVDHLATRVVPIEVEYSGALPHGYWQGQPALGASTISVSGPAEDVSKVSKAICDINLAGRRTSYNESVLLRYIDGDSNEVDRALFLNTLPSVVVKMDILPTALIPINVEDAIMGTQALAVNYEVYDIISTPPAVRAAGPEKVLSELQASGINIENIDVSGKNSSVQQDITITVPEGITLLDDPNINVYVDIREKQETVEFTDLEINVRGLGNKLTAELSEKMCTASVTGRVTLMKLLERGDVKVYADLTGLGAGTHTAQLKLSFPREDMQTEFEWTLSIPEVTVTIKE